MTLQLLPPIVTSPELLRDKARELHNQQQQQQQLSYVSPAATTATMDESAVDQPTKTAVTATPQQSQTNAVAPSSCRRFRFADAFSSPSQPTHPITSLSYTASPAAAASVDAVDVRIQRLEDKCRELEEAKRRSHAAWMEELSSQALMKQQLIAHRQTIEQLEQQTATLAQQRDTHATRVQQLQAEMSANIAKQLDDGGKLALLQEQHSFLDEVSAQQSAAITELKADVVAKEQQLAALQCCLEGERRRYEELRSGVDGSLASGQQLRVALEASQAELQAVLQDKEQLIQQMDALERQVNEAAAREQHKATQDREANKRAEAERKQLTAQWEDSESERQQLLQQTAQLQADILHWQHKYQNEADSHTATQHQQQALTLTLHHQPPTNTTTPHAISPTSASTAHHHHTGEHKEERVSRLAAVRRQLTEMRDNISQRLAAIRPVKRKDERLLALQAELERSEAEMERLLKEHETTWQQVNRARRERCLSCGGFHNALHGSSGGQREATAQHASEGSEVAVAGDSKDALLSEMSAFNQRLQADNAALRAQVEALMKERNEALAASGRRHSGESEKRSAGKRVDKRAREYDDKENEAVLQPLDVNVKGGEHKHRRSLTASGGNKRQSLGMTAQR